MFATLRVEFQQPRREVVPGGLAPGRHVIDTVRGTPRVAMLAELRDDGCSAFGHRVGPGGRAALVVHNAHLRTLVREAQHGAKEVAAGFAVDPAGAEDHRAIGGSEDSLLARALRISDPGANGAHYAQTVEFAHQAPSLVVLISAPIAGHKIPLWEQQLSAGAAAMNLLTATHAMGFVGGWITGWMAYSDLVRDVFCKPGERIAGFMFLGSPGRPLEERPRPDMTQIVRHWDGVTD